uniref:SFRICE_013405 n=1 Tax=Spodoptera frugiperda TaxID=7108 RepID=A0A2H1WEA7_SPOFR
MVNNTLPDPGIEPETSCPAVALATTRPTRHSSLRGCRGVGHGLQLTVQSSDYPTGEAAPE